MPRIETEPKLDFKDVLIRPKRSTLKSRADVDLVREYTFRNSKKSYTGVPVMSSNMDTTGTFEMATALAANKMFTCIHKHYTVSLRRVLELSGGLLGVSQRETDEWAGERTHCESGWERDEGSKQNRWKLFGVIGSTVPLYLERREAYLCAV